MKNVLLSDDLFNQGLHKIQSPHIFDSFARLFLNKSISAVVWNLKISSIKKPIVILLLTNKISMEMSGTHMYSSFNVKTHMKKKGKKRSERETETLSLYFITNILMLYHVIFAWVIEFTYSPHMICVSSINFGTKQCDH